MHASAIRRGAGTAVLLTLATACSFGGADSSSKSHDSITMEYQNFPILDPQRVTWGMWLAASGLYEGLVELTPDGRSATPGTAERWDISADRRTYTFHLRASQWSDGSPVTANDFVFAYKRMLTPSSAQAGITQGANSYLPGIDIKGGLEFQAGTLKDWSQVGIKAPDSSTLVLTLSHPNADFLLNLAHPSMMPLPEKVLTAHPVDWQTAQHWVGNGPYVVSKWVVNSSMVLTRNEKYFDVKNVAIKQVNLKLSEADGLSNSALHFKNGEVDIAPLQQQDVKEFLSDPQKAKDVVSIPSFLSSYLAVLHSKNAVLEDVRVRHALSLAMGRSEVAKACSGCSASYSLLPRQVEGSDQTSIREDIDQAKQLLAAAGHPGGRGLPAVHLLLSDPVLEPAMEAIADNWQRNLGIRAKVDMVEAGVYVDRRLKLQSSDYVGFYAGSFSTVATPRAWASVVWNPMFTQQFSLSGPNWQAFTNLKTGTTSQQYLNSHASQAANRFAQLTEQAQEQTDPAKAAALYTQAAQVRAETYLFLPTICLDGDYLVRPGVTGVDKHFGFLLPFSLKTLKKV
jgi:ABC-type oligopeptide transport system substrate-binding subunit